MNKGINRLLHAFGGSYELHLQGESCLPFLRRLGESGIRFWDFCNREDGWQVSTSLAGAKPLLELAADAGLSCEIGARRGLPFLLERYRKRAGLLLGLLVGMFLLFYAELFVWKVSVKGNAVLTEREVVQALERYGIGVGSYIPAIRVTEAQNEFLMEYHDISSVAINICGTHIEVEVLERTHAPELVDTSGACNLVASVDGIVRTVEVAAGTAVVKPGDVVLAGQLLVSGYTADLRNVYRTHHARGIIKATVYESFSTVVPLDRVVKTYTGKTQRKTTLTALGKTFDAFASENVSYALFDVEVTETPVRLFGLAETPLVKTTALYREYREEILPLTKEDAQALAEEALRDWVELHTDLLLDMDVKVEYDQIQNACVLNASVAWEKDIGMEVPLSPGEAPPDAVVPPTA